jgi:hypothetical protein
MYRLTREGSRAAATPCPVTGNKHRPCDIMAQLDTFYCSACGATPRDSIWHDMDERYRYDAYTYHQDGAAQR